MVLFSRYFNGELLVTRTIHVVAALSGGGHDLDENSALSVVRSAGY
jgi:hypothetical protein